MDIQPVPNSPPAHPAISRGLAAGRSLFVIQSDETLLVQEAADHIRQAARQAGFTERQVFTVAGAHFRWNEVLEAASALSLFADKQLLELRIPSGKPGKDGAIVLEQLASQAEQNDALLSIVTLPRLDKKTKENSWCRALERAGVVVAMERIERRQLPQWLAQRLAAQGQQVARGEEGERSLQWMADRVEGNLLAASQEILKLGLLYPPRFQLAVGLCSRATNAPGPAKPDFWALARLCPWPCWRYGRVGPRPA